MKFGKERANWALQRKNTVRCCMFMDRGNVSFIWLAQVALKRNRGFATPSTAPKTIKRNKRGCTFVFCKRCRSTKRYSFLYVPAQGRDHCDRPCLASNNGPSSLTICSDAARQTCDFFFPWRSSSIPISRIALSRSNIPDCVQ